MSLMTSMELAVQILEDVEHQVKGMRDAQRIFYIYDTHGDGECPEDCAKCITEELKWQLRLLKSEVKYDSLV